MNYQEAYELAVKMHKGQKRKVIDEDYISHPLAVANTFRSGNYKIVSILHDIIEDTNITLEHLRSIGLNEELLEYVDILTRKPNQTYIEYILLCKKYIITRRIKIVDIRHNLNTFISKCHTDKYLMALYILGNSNEY
jgi:(p)ppGpp synthase/HD superfamily hydrolase